VKIALFYVHNLLACHYALFGYRETLERMGHEVLDIPFPQNAPVNVEQVPVPTLQQLLDCDVVLSTYHEYVQPWLERKYPYEQWEALMATVPVLARFDESMDRGDLALPHRVPHLKRWATHYSFPAAQDAEKYGGDWLPYGADTTIFNPFGKEDITITSSGSTEKLYDLAFIGTPYDKRRKYLEKLVAHVDNSYVFRIANVVVQDLSGIRERESTLLLAENYRQVKLFFCLPPMSNLLVEKIFDVMACDTMVMYPRLQGEAEKNLIAFEDEKHILYYDIGFFSNNGKQVNYYLNHPEEMERIARAGGERVRSKYTLEQMLQSMLTQAKCQPRAIISNL
jgi:Glycosyl transferases group 1